MKTDLELFQAKREELQAHSFETIERLKELDIEIDRLAEEKKPELRHGDYYFDRCSHVIIMADGSKWLLCYGRGGIVKLNTKDTIQRFEACGYKYTYNIFDDLKALSEEVERDKEYIFEGHGLRLLMCGSTGNVHFRGTGFWTKDLEPIILKLRQMQATIKKEGKL